MVKTELIALPSGRRKLTVTLPGDSSAEYLSVGVPIGASLNLGLMDQFEIVATKGIAGKEILYANSDNARLLVRQRGLVSNTVPLFSPVNHSVPLEALIGSGPMAAASRRILSKAQCMPGDDFTGGSKALEIDEIHPLSGLTKKSNPLEVDPIRLIAETISYLRDTLTYSLTPPGFQRKLESELISPGRASFSDVYSAMQRAFPVAMVNKDVQHILMQNLPFSELSRVGVKAKSKIVWQTLGDLGLMVYFSGSSEGNPNDILLSGVAKCTGFSKVYVELTRRFGLNSETRVGLVYSGGTWGAHMWAVTDVSSYSKMEVDPTMGFMGKQKEERGIKLSYDLAFIYGKKDLVPTVEAVTAQTLASAQQTLFAAHGPGSSEAKTHMPKLEQQVATYR